jgi:hypothetical protein
LFEPAFQPRHIVSDKRQAKRQHPQTENWQNRKNPTKNEQDARNKPEPEA